MLFRRSDLARAGGVAALGYTIAEDSALSRALAGIGLATVFAENTVDQEIGARTLGDVYARQARWAVIRRNEEPVTFALRAAGLPRCRQPWPERSAAPLLDANGFGRLRRHAARLVRDARSPPTRRSAGS